MIWSIAAGMMAWFLLALFWAGALALAGETKPSILDYCIMFPALLVGAIWEWKEKKFDA